MKTIKELVEIAKASAIEAGKMLREKRESLRQVNEELAHDFKTQADLESEKLIRERLTPLGLQIIGEEHGGQAPTDLNELYWVVDPLDGTVNYVHGMPWSTVSIALMRGIEPVGGAVYDFWQDVLYWAAEGEGAWKNDKKLEPMPYKKRANQLYFLGDNDEHIAKEFMQERLLWCSTLQICYIAEGKAGGIAETAKIWDWAGGIALMRELGYRYIIKKDESRPLVYRFEAYREMANANEK